LLRCSNIPPAHDHTIAKGVGESLPFAAILHLAFGIWIYTHPQVFPTTKVDDPNTVPTGEFMNAGDRLLCKSSFPLFFALILLILTMFTEKCAMFLKFLIEELRDFINAGCRRLPSIFCCCCRRCPCKIRKRVTKGLEKIANGLHLLAGEEAEAEVTKGRYSEHVPKLKVSTF